MVLQEKDGDGAKELQEMHSERMKVLQLDVCSDEQVANAVEFVKANLEDSEKGTLWHVWQKDRPFYGGLVLADGVQIKRLQITAV